MTRIKSIAVIGLLLLLIGSALLLTGRFTDVLQLPRLRLPVGSGTPAISLGERHGLILASDGSLWTWGSDFLGWPVLGLGSNTLKSVYLRRVGHDTNWACISAGLSHNLAIRSDGTLWTWGESVHPQHTRPTAIYIPVPAAPGNDWKQAAAGGIFSIALKKDGTLWAWGNNWGGSVGIPSTNGSVAPVQVGLSTNWVRVWADVLETVALQSDGTLWYWGDNPDPSFAQDVGKIVAPTRVNSETNWVDVGFGVNTVFAIKSDGTLWTWGRQAERYTGARDTTKNVIPTRVGTNSDWRHFADTRGWWRSGLIKKDGSLWFMDGSDGKPNGPQTPYPPVQFRRIEFPKPYVAFAAGATHAAPAGWHEPIAVALTRDGEVWTCGMILGDPMNFADSLRATAARVERRIFPTKPWDAPDPRPIRRDKPWQLRNIDSY